MNDPITIESGHPRSATSAIGSDSPRRSDRRGKSQLAAPAASLLNRKAAVREAMLQGPMLATMLSLAWPTIVVLIAQIAVGVAETFYVSYLGTAALAGVALVFPILMLMTMMSNGGVGGGVASAVARAIGAGRRDDADALVMHALVIAVVFGLMFTAVTLLFGGAIYGALGGTGTVLEAALTYSGFVFAGAVPSWIVSLLAAALRGAGNVRVPAIVTFISAVVLIGLSPALIFGFGPFPRLGIAGAGTAVTAFNVVAAFALMWYMASGLSTPTLARSRPQRRLFRDVLGVGLLSALGTVQFNVTVLLVTGAVGLFGVEALAGYGIASRLDYLLVPLLFGLGTAVVTMVGTNIGAGAVVRARRIAWTGALLGAMVSEAIGVWVVAYPTAWLGLFSTDAAVLETGSLYLRTVGPFYGATGLGLLLYFASQGAGHMLWPVLAGFVRLTTAALAGWLAVAWLGLGEQGLFVMVAAGTGAFGAINAVAVRLATWAPAKEDEHGQRRRRSPGRRSA